ncbi:MAG: sensor histidine kinase [Alphaproteobacteria bacterium]|nr:MAG: sensor histidine kinase [Alphaproteobacteria bacterium]
MARWSIANRLIGTLTFALSALWLAATAASSFVMLQEIGEVFDSALQETAQRLLPLAVDHIRDLADNEDDDKDEEWGREITDTLPVPAHKEYLIYQVRDVRGHLLLRSHDAPTAPFPIPLRPGFQDFGDWRYYTETTRDRTLFIQVAERLSKRTEAIQETLLSQVAPLVALIPLTAILIVWTVRRATQPIERVREEIRRRGGTNLSPIPDTDLPVELVPIIRDVNRLLERLNQALEGERAFAANSAHELRTPVATALAQVQRLIAELGQGPDKERAMQIAETLRRLANLVEKLLQLARAEAGIGLSREPVDLLPVVRLLVDEFSRRGDVGSRLRFDTRGLSALPARIDIDAFGIALRNVLDNALMHGVTDAPIEVTVMPDRSIHVISGGPPVPREVLASLTQRFKRGRARGPGSGLGLAIADAIMRQSGGALELKSPATGRDDGFEVVLRLQ